MKLIITISIIIALLIGLAIYDSLNWQNVNHMHGVVVSGMVLVPLCVWNWSLWPAFVYAIVWNPLIAMLHGKGFFYMGDTAWLDRNLKYLFGMFAGQVWFGAMAVGLWATIILKHERQEN